MTPIAHIVGLPVEELVLSLVSGGGALLLVVARHTLLRLRTSARPAHHYERGEH